MSKYSFLALCVCMFFSINCNPRMGGELDRFRGLTVNIFPRSLSREEIESPDPCPVSRSPKDKENYFWPKEQLRRKAGSRKRFLRGIVTGMVLRDIENVAKA